MHRIYENRRLTAIQGRSYQTNPESFARAIKIAIEAEADKPNKIKSKIENINNVEIGLDSKEEFQQTVKELNNNIQQLKQKSDFPQTIYFLLYYKQKKIITSLVIFIQKY